MPLYEYRCSKCQRVFEVIQKFSDIPLAVHEDCGGEVERLVSAPAFQFKGSGWYVTDYAKGSGAGPKPPASSSSSDSGSNDSKKTSDSKPAESTTKSDSTSKTESKPKSD